MKCLIYKTILGGVIASSIICSVYAEDTKVPDAADISQKRNCINSIAIGFSYDLFPTVISAVSEKAGYAFQAWVGIEHVKIRLVGGRLYLPEAFLARDFTRQDTTVAAMIVDYVFGEHFGGFWVGGGIEIWYNTIHHTGGNSATWINGVLTIGGGYIWRFYKNLYLEPYVALHLIMNDERIYAGDDSYKQFPLSGSISVKFGYFFDI